MKKLALIVALAAMFGTQTIHAQYQQHDGSAETSIGVTGGIINWGTMFNVDPSATILDSIDVGFGVDNGTVGGDPGIAGLDVAWQVFGDDDADPTTGLTALTAIGTHTIVNEDFTNNGLFDNINVGGIDISAFNNLFISFSFQDLEGDQFAAAQDTGSDNATSWAAVPGALDPGDYAGGAPIGAFGLPGHWIITGNASAIPEPSTFAVLGLCAGFAAIRRRR